MNNFINKLGSNTPYIVIFDHDLGGGSLLYRKRLIASLLLQNKKLILVLATETYKPASVEISIITPTDSSAFTDLSSLDVFSYLDQVVIEEIIVNSLVSYRPFMAFTQALLNFLKQTKYNGLSIAFHEYFPICPSFNLLNHKGEYCHAPQESECEKCRPLHSLRMLKENDIDLWQNIWLNILTLATKIIVFSQSSLELVSKKFPSVSPKIRLIPHSMAYFKVASIRPKTHLTSALLNIGVVGNMTFHKGSEVIAKLSEYIAEFSLPAQVTVFGDLDKAESVKNINVLGHYENSQLPQLIEAHSIDVFLFPSICPETFSYVVEELMLLKQAIVSFDIGAQGEKVKAYSRGDVVDLSVSMSTMYQCLKKYKLNSFE